jgi:hypothetical protein
VFRELVRYWDSNRHLEKRQWGDSRLVWIPLHYVLTPDECDSQAEIDAIIELAVHEQFTDANDVHYIINELFQPELHRMIHAARDYHVLWIHDYRGKNTAGKPDRIGYMQTVDAYMRALTERVRDYESTRKIPVYIIILDQVYYEANDGRKWMTLLEDPLGHNIQLHKDFEEWEGHIREVQEELRAAVEASPTLQAGKKRYGDAWLKNMIKVHVNNTNPADMSFRSNYLFGWLPFIPDSLWNSAFWAGMMVGAALRGCCVFPVAPSFANAPSDGLPQMTRANEVFTRLVIIQNEIKEEIESAGGMFRVGIFNAQHDLGDVAANIRTFNRGAAESEVYRKIFPFDQSVYDFFEHMEETIDTTRIEVVYLTEDVDDRRPKLHVKTQFFASGEALESLITMEEWKPVVVAYFQARAKQMQVRGTYVDAKELRKMLGDSAEPLGEKWYSQTPQEIQEKAFFYLTVGSHNMDYRGKFMDGEVSVVVAGSSALLAYLDFAGIMGKTIWVDTVEELNKLLPAQGSGTRGMARFVKNAL